MTRDRWTIVWDLFSAAADLPAVERSAFLSSASVEPDVRDEVMALLEASLACSVSNADIPRSPSGPDFPGGYEFGRYVIVGAIGEGGFGKIYAAHDRDLRRVVALKVLSGTMRDQAEPLIEEARAASALNHPNIVTVYETIAVDGHFAIVMEFVDGQSLRQLLQNTGRPLAIATVLRYGIQIARALQVAHEAGITHHDVKPENILVRKDEFVKLVDFGLAADAAKSFPVSSARLAGTLRYISPEQLNGGPGSPASDMFSLGLVLYEMAAGVHAFQRDTPLAAAEAIATQQPLPISRRIPGTPREFDRLVAVMLSRTPAARPSSSQVAKTLEEIAARTGTKRKRIAIWLAAAAAIGLLSLIVLTRPSRPISLRMDTRPLTGESGRESAPAISPGGESVVYLWQERPASRPVTFLRDINSDRKIELPFGRHYSWTPDGRRIGFVRRDPGHDALCTIDRNGSTDSIEEVFRTEAIGDFEWSPKGESIVFTALDPKPNKIALFLYSTDTRKIRQLTYPSDSSPPLQEFAISSDGRSVAYRSRLSFGRTDVFLIDLLSPSSERQITFHQTTGEGIAWLSGSSAIISSAMRGANHSLWLHSLSSPGQPVRLTEIGMDALQIRAARGRNRLVWVNLLEDTNVWSLSLKSGGKPVRVTSSALRDSDVASSSSGLLAFRSDRSGFPEIWISASDGSSPKRVTNLASFTGSPAWSPDGRRIVFDSRLQNQATNIYMMDCEPARMECSAPVQLTDDPASDAIPSWSADGTHVYFASQRSGQWQVWKIAANGNRQPAVQVTIAGGYFATESPDGAWLYYSRVDSANVTGIWRKRLNAPAGEPGEMVVPAEFAATATWKLVNDEVFYYTLGSAERPPTVKAFNIQTRQTRKVYDLGTGTLARGLAVSPGGDSVFFVRYDRSESTIMVSDYEVVK